jgi:hypothetical protein
MQRASMIRDTGKLWAAVCLLLVGLSTGPSRAEAPAEPVSVVELFTSQGCSSCPPADRLFKSYAERKDLVALSFSVDYWDYLGWKDTLASPKFTERQRSYARARGDGQVYTPQVVVNGIAHEVGSDRERIDAAIQRTSRAIAPARLPVRCWGEDGAIVVEIGAAPAGWPAALGKPSGTVWLALVEPKVDVAVKHGENRGRSLTYYNVVRELMPAGMYSGAGTTIRLPRGALPGGHQRRFAAVLQQGTTGAMVGAAWMSPQR